MAYFTLRDTTGIPFTSQEDTVPPDKTKAKTSLDGCDGEELDSTLFHKNSLITGEEILNLKPRICTV